MKTRRHINEILGYYGMKTIGIGADVRAIRERTSAKWYIVENGQPLVVKNNKKETMNYMREFCSKIIQCPELKIEGR